MQCTVCLRQLRHRSADRIRPAVNCTSLQLIAWSDALRGLLVSALPATADVLRNKSYGSLTTTVRTSVRVSLVSYRPTNNLFNEKTMTERKADSNKLILMHPLGVQYYADVLTGCHFVVRWGGVFKSCFF